MRYRMVCNGKDYIPFGPPLVAARNLAIMERAAVELWLCLSTNRSWGSGTALVAPDDQDASLPVDVGPEQFADFAESAGSQAEEPDDALEGFICAVADFFDYRVWHRLAGIALGIADAGERVPIDTTLPGRPIEHGRDLVRLCLHDIADAIRRRARDIDSKNELLPIIELLNERADF